MATQAIGGYGLDMTDSKTVVFYANGFKYGERLQVEDRVHRIGQSRNVLYIDLWADIGIERRIEQALLRKESAVEEFQREVERIKNLKDGGLDELLQTI